MTDHVSNHRTIRAIFGGEVRNAPADAWTKPVPATPEWTVRDVCAHLAGTAADLNAGNIAGVGTDEWTAAQVDARRDVDVIAILDEWDRESQRVEDALPQLPDWVGAQLVGDAVTHAVDAEAVLGVAGLRNAAAVPDSARYYGKLAAKRCRDAGLAPLRFALDDAELPADVVVVRGSPFELLRAATGRRSVAQIRALDWGGADPEPYLTLFSTYAPPETDLAE